MGPDYLRPKVLIPNDYRGALEPAKAESLADIPWWELFKDPVLQELTREALSNNYDLQTAAARVEEARAQIGVVRSFLYPQVNCERRRHRATGLAGHRPAADIRHQP